MDMPSTPQGTGITEAQAAERLIARYQSDEDQGEANETEAVEETEADDQLTEGDEPEDDEVEGDPEQEPDEAEGEPDQPQTFRVKVDGAEVEVPLDELLKGYSREQDYTRKTQALSEDRRALVETRDRYASQLDIVSQIIEAQQPKVDQSLRETDPAEWSAQMLQHKQWAEHRQAVETERHRVEAEQAKEQEKARASALSEESARLLAAIPEWADAEVSKAEQARITKYAVESAGLKPEEADAISDHRIVVQLRKAMLYDELMAKKPEVQRKLQQVKTLKPQAQSRVSRSDEKQWRDRLAQSGSTDAAAQILLARSRRA